MFKFLKKKELIENKIYSPINGKCIPIEEVPDNVFASKMMGSGVGLILSDDTIYSPCDATVSMIALTKHAIGLQAKNGAEILIHIGLDTVQLNGKGFSLLVNQNDKVDMGQPIMKIDREYMEENNLNLITPLVITNSGDINPNIICDSGNLEKGKSVLIEWQAKRRKNKTYGSY